MDPTEPIADKAFDMYTEILMNGFVPDRVYYAEIGRWIDQKHPLTVEEFNIIFREKNA